MLGFENVANNLSGLLPKPKKPYKHPVSKTLLNRQLYFSSTISYRIPKSLDRQIAEVTSRASSSWLEQPDEGGSFPTNGDRFAAQELTKRRDLEGYTRKGFLLQILAVVYHKKSPAQLREMADKVGRERIQVVHGTIDNLITFPHAKVLLDALGGEEAGVTKVVFEGRGHYIPMEERGRFKVVIESLIEKTKKLR